MIIALDFDGTLFEHKFPAIGEPRLWMIEKAKEWRMRGHKLILWTCRSDVKPGESHAFAAGEYLTDAINACKKYGLEFDAHNMDLGEVNNPGILFSRKVYADVYIDDKSVSFDDRTQTFQFNELMCMGDFL